jgi:hypothetical protein
MESPLEHSALTMPDKIVLFFIFLATFSMSFHYTCIYVRSLLFGECIFPVYFTCARRQKDRRNAHSQLHRCTTKSVALSATIQIYLRVVQEPQKRWTLRVFENTLMWRIFGPKREEVAAGCRDFIMIA